MDKEDLEEGGWPTTLWVIGFALLIAARFYWKEIGAVVAVGLLGWWLF